MTIFEKHALEMYKDNTIANEGLLDIIATSIGAIGAKLKSILIKIFIGNAYFTSTDPKVIRDYMVYVNAKKDGVNIFADLQENASEIKALTVKFNDAKTNEDITKILTKFKEYEKKLNLMWAKYIPDDKDLFELIQVNFSEYNTAVRDINVSMVPNLEDILPFLQTVIDNTSKTFPQKSKELQELFNKLFMPYFDMMANLMVHIYYLPAPQDTERSIVEDFPDTKKPWFMLWDMPVFKAKINGSAFMYNVLPSYQGRSRYPKGAIFVDVNTFHLMPDYYQKFVLYHEYGHAMSFRNSKELLMSNSQYYSGECLSDLFAYAMLAKDLPICIKALKKIVDVYVKYYKCSKPFMEEQMNIRVSFLTVAVGKGRGETYDDVISLNKYTDVLDKIVK